QARPSSERPCIWQLCVPGGICPGHIADQAVWHGVFVYTGRGGRGLHRVSGAHADAGAAGQGARAGARAVLRFPQPVCPASQSARLGGAVAPHAGGRQRPTRDLSRRVGGRGHILGRGLSQTKL
ncbi:hypothetical protein H4S01_003951, partial [Coemansia sp. RSA 2610]